MGRKEKSNLECLDKTARCSAESGVLVGAAVNTAEIRWKILVIGERMYSTMTAQRFEGQGMWVSWVLLDRTLQ